MAAFCLGRAIHIAITWQEAPPPSPALTEPGHLGHPYIPVPLYFTRLSACSSSSCRASSPRPPSSLMWQIAVVIAGCTLEGHHPTDDI